jgi:hypothetical protein
VRAALALRDRPFHPYRSLGERWQTTAARATRAAVAGCGESFFIYGQTYRLGRRHLGFRLCYERPGKHNRIARYALQIVVHRLHDDLRLLARLHSGNDTDRLGRKKFTCRDKNSALGI